MPVRRAAWCLACLASLAWLWCAGCDKREPPGRGAVARPTPEQLARAWAGRGSRVDPYRAVLVPGYEIFWVTTSSEFGPTGAFGVAVPVAEEDFLEGKGALRALMAQGVSDPMELALLTVLFLERGGQPLAGPATPVHERFGVVAPHIENGVLSYWYERTSDEFIELLHADLPLDTLDLSTRSVNLQEFPNPARRAKPPGHP